MALDWNYILNGVLWNNTGRQWYTALGIFLVSILILKIFKSYFLHYFKKLARKTKNGLDDIFIDFIAGIHWPFFVFISLYIASHSLILPAIVMKSLYYILIIMGVFYGIKFVHVFINYFVARQIEKRTKEDKLEDTSFIKLMGNIVKAFFWIIALLLILSNLGINITSLVAGLGIGGIAIAFALQNILSDLFSSFSIHLDKPFRVGDFIIIGDDMGTVKHIGLKSTRIETLKGQELVVANKELTSARVNNYKKMKKRRIQFNFGVEYGTPVKKLKKINDIVKKILEDVDADLDRVHFKEFGASSLNYEVVYYVNSRDYMKYADTQQEINLKLAEAFQKEKIEFAFPTQTIHVKK